MFLLVNLILFVDIPQSVGALRSDGVGAAFASKPILWCCVVREHVGAAPRTCRSCAEVKSDSTWVQSAATTPQRIQSPITRRSTNTTEGKLVLVQV